MAGTTATGFLAEKLNVSVKVTDRLMINNILIKLSGSTDAKTPAICRLLAQAGRASRYGKEAIPTAPKKKNARRTARAVAFTAQRRLPDDHALAWRQIHLVALLDAECR